MSEAKPPKRPRPVQGDSSDVLSYLRDLEDYTTRIEAIAHALQGENAIIHAQLDDVMHAGDLEHARMAALIEACAVMAEWIAAYKPQSPLARAQPQFYRVFRTHGQQLRAAVSAVRPQADVMHAELHLLRELAADVARWREGGGDPRDMAYILETMDRITEMQGVKP